MPLPGRWRILAVLFLVRAAMGFQFQSVAAVAPLLGRDLAIGLADIGLLIGLYLMPGVVLGLPGGAIGRRLGDKPVVLFGLVLMAFGGAVMAFVPTWEGQMAGRLLGGIGGVLLNVLMSKMVTDWFGEREIATAMGIFVNSWPAGIGLALVTLPAIGAAWGVAAVFITTSALVILGIALLWWLYHPPASPEVAVAEAERVPLGAAARRAVIIAGLAWGLYNIGFALIFSFGPTLMVERGWSLTDAGSVASLVLWLALVSVPLGGFLADRSGRPGAVAVLGCVLSAILLLLAQRLDAVLLFAGLGIFGGLPAGALMSLPAHVLVPGTRALGMGVFYTVFYIGVAIGPMLGGWVAAQAGTAAAALYFAAAALTGCLMALRLFHRHMPRAEPA